MLSDRNYVFSNCMATDKVVARVIMKERRFFIINLFTLFLMLISVNLYAEIAIPGVNRDLLRLAAATYTFTYKTPGSATANLVSEGKITRVELDLTGTYPDVVIYGKAQNDTSGGWDECHYQVAPEREMSHAGAMVEAATDTYNKLRSIKNNPQYQVNCTSHTLQQGSGVNPQGYFYFNVFHVQENSTVDNFSIVKKVPITRLPDLDPIFRLPIR